ncbi:hypothetical protein BC828DRAFT_384285 [Blastocladiella britannica]|nr:hypothetical protein BC828DRAFT_384285 [Blastocladiella britannica]
MSAPSAFPVAQALTTRYFSHLLHYVRHPGLVYFDVVLPIAQSPAEHIEKLLIREHPYVLSMHVCAGMIAWTFASGTITGNYSSVDRLWSVVPAVYAWLFFLQAWPDFDYRLFALAAVTTIWASRLTFNFWRRGGYNGEEDYRWPWLRSIIKEPYGVVGAVAWHIFSFAFISVYQCLLLWAIIVPIGLEVYTVRYRPKQVLSRTRSVYVPWTHYDTAATVLALACIALEAVADNQQWTFQTQKHKLLAAERARLDRGPSAVHTGRASASMSGKSVVAPSSGSDREILGRLPAPYHIGFPTTGLFKYSRHANYFGEISLWFCLHLYVVAATATSTTLSVKPNLPFDAAVTLALSADWSTLFVVTGRATARVAAIPLARWSLTGALNLLMLFNGSTAITEWITERKYPWYKEYVVRTSRWMPFFSGGEVVAPRKGPADS